ncbi:hypothetical protein BXZ70DRAFT_452836 [Cristinia sonorae]|uniref:DUF2415 domain-containing protein n=1 Tax=Cristinia sonorae TaxID=1940300 RepID=A0A8K0UI17_9AGAR|nr:hypothetical protein BXZ70DRAFT_452836 [Cristinia sonorae]
MDFGRTWTRPTLLRAILRSTCQDLEIFELLTAYFSQLRDVLICPHEPGVVCYPQKQSIVEHNLASSESRHLTNLAFVPSSVSSLNIPDSGETLLAVGGLDAELHLSLYSPPSHSLAPLVDAEGPNPLPLRGFGRQQWRSEVILEPPASINNSVHLTSLGLTGSHESSVEPRVIISNNDKTVKFYDVAIRVRGAVEHSISHRPRQEMPVQRLAQVGQLKLEVPVNHSSLSPDGRTLLSVGDSPDIYLHRINGSSRVSFTPISKLSLSSYINTPSYLYNPHAYSNSAVAASFSTAFSSNGSKFAVASQEGVVVVWDVRSSKPLKVIQTDKTRRSGERGNGNGAASGWVFDTPWDWSRGMGNAPGWGVRSVKFSPASAGREVMTFTEHTSLLHVVDARTFETEEIVRVPNSEPHPTVLHSGSRSPHARSGSSPPPRDPVIPPPPRSQMLSGAVEDAFRISISESGTRRRRYARRTRGARDDVASPTTDEDPEMDGIVVIPPLGDLEVENDVRRLLILRTSHARTRSSLQTPTFSSQDEPRDLDDERDDERERERERLDRIAMDVDDYDAECLSSYTPSRSASPSLSAPMPSSSTHPPSATSNLPPSISASSSTTIRLSMPSHIADHPLRLSRPAFQRPWRDYSDPYSRLSAGRSSSRRQRRNAQREEEQETVTTSATAAAEVEVEQDLAGLCFDPTGEYVYVAATKGISTWRVRGADKSWWIDSTWA